MPNHAEPHSPLAGLAVAGAGSRALPEEALLLAMVEQLGQLAGAFLRQSGFARSEVGRFRSLQAPGRPGQRTVEAPQGLLPEPVEVLRALLESYAARAQNGHAPGERPQERAEPPGSSAGSPSLQELAEAAALLERYWASRPPVSVLERYGEQVDVSTPQGRWELVALAVLGAAPLPRFRIEETFCTLRRLGLLDFSVASEATPEWAQSVDQVMDATYRGRVRRGVQRQRLQQAAAVLKERFEGDLNRLWEEAGADPDAAVRLIRSHFQGLARLASWVVREMGRLGQWPEAHRHPAARFADAHVRAVLENLGIVAHGSPIRVVEAVVDQHFRGGCAVLFSHGKDRCGRRSLGVCLRHCPITRLCRAWRRWARAPQAEHPGPGGR